MEGLDERGPEMGLWRWLDERANRKTDVVPRDLLWVEEEGARRVLGSRSTANQDRILAALVTLTDNDIIETVDYGGSKRVKVLLKPPSEKNPVEDCSGPNPAERRGVSLARSAGVTEPTTIVGRSTGGQTGSDGKSQDRNTTHLFRSLVRVGPQGQESAQKYERRDRARVLAQDVFPRLLREHGVRISSGNWQALTWHFRRWHDEGISYGQIQLWIEEFVQHPQWCRSKNPPGGSFVGRRSMIEELMETRQRRDPSGRQFQRPDDDRYWLGRLTPSAVSTA